MKKNLHTLLFCCALLNSATLFCQSNDFWEPLQGPLDVHSIHAVGRRAAGGELFVAMGQHMYRSDDQGISWVAADDGISPLNFTESRFFNTRSGNFYFQNQYLVLYRYNGQTEAWEFVDNPDPVTNNALAFDVDSSGRFWRVQFIDKFIYYTEDEGQTYTEVKLNTTPPGFVNILASLDKNHQLLWTNTGNTHYLYHFDADGKVDLIRQSLEPFRYLGFNTFTGTGFYSDRTGLYRSTDGGLTWQPSPVLPQSGNQPVIKNMVFDSAASIWAADNLGRFLHSTDDGLTWSVYNQLSDRYNYVKLPGDDWFHLNNCGEYTFARSSDGGVSWVDLAENFLFPTVDNIQQDPAGNLYALTCRRKAYEWSTDEGQSWEPYRPLVGGTPMDVTQLAIREDGLMLAAGKNERFYRSFNFGADWLEWNTPYSGQLNTQDFFRLSLGYQGDIYLHHLDGIQKSTDNGDTWSELNMAIPGNGAYTLFVQPNGDIIYGTPGSFSGLTLAYQAALDTVELLSVEAYPIHSTAGGYTFLVAFTDLFPATRFSDLYRIGPNSGFTVEKVATFTSTQYGMASVMCSNPAGDLFLVFEDSLYRSQDNGSTWSALAAMPDNVSTLQIFTGRDNRLYLANHRSVIFRSKQATVGTSGGPENVTVPVRVYPNPAREHVRFEIAGLVDSGTKTLTLTDRLGRVVHQERFTGTFLQMPCGHMEAGIYFYRIDGVSGLLGNGKVALH